MHTPAELVAEQRANIRTQAPRFAGTKGGEVMMREQVLSVVAAFITLGALYLAGVLLLLDPVEARDVPSAPLLPLPLAFLIAIAVYVALFVWLERVVGDPFKAAMAIVLPQMALVNVDFVLSGKRGIATAAASTAILFISWTAVAWAYKRLRGGGE